MFGTWHIVIVSLVAVCNVVISTFLSPTKTNSLASLIQPFLAKRTVGLNEPPTAPPAIPLLGHVIGLLREGPWYYGTLSYVHSPFAETLEAGPAHLTHGTRKRSRHAIFSIDILGSTAYVVKTPEAFRVVEKLSHVINPNTMVPKMGSQLFLYSPRFLRVMEACVTSDRVQGHSMFSALSDHADKMLLPGPALTQMVALAQQEMVVRVHQLAPSSSETLHLQLYRWVQLNVAQTGIAALFGPQYPLATDTSLIEDYLLFEDNVHRFASFPMPALTMRKAFLARQRVLAAISAYISKDPHAQRLSPFMQAVHGSKDGSGASIQDMSSIHLTILLALILNVVPCTFWLIAEILARPQLLATVRGEIDGCVRGDGQNASERTWSAERLRGRSPVLMSTLQEVYRHKSLQLTIREVLETTVVYLPSEASSYVLRKGARVHMPASVPQLDSQIWGQGADDFGPYRFLSLESASPEDRRRKKSAMRHFGTGAHTCPGRYLGESIILMTTSLFVSMLDVQTVGGDAFNVPPPARRLLLSTCKPAHDVEVLVRSRKCGGVFRAPQPSS